MATSDSPEATEHEQSEAAARTHWLRLLAIVAAALGAAWLFSPSFQMVHVEGFSASIAALALHLAYGSLADFDLVQPFNTEYFALTKFGMVLAVAGLTGGLGIGSELALRIVMWAGFAGLVGGSIALGRRWSGAPWWLALPALALMPGVFESQFFYNDNVPAAGMLATGLALLYVRRTALALPLAGLLLGLAVLTRTDTVLAGVAAPLMLLARYGRTSAALRAMAVVGTTAALTLLVPLALFGASILDVLAVGGSAVELWDRANGFTQQLTILIYYFSLPGLLLAGLGAYALCRRHDLMLLAVVIGTPMLFVAILYGSIWEARQLLVLTPFFVALVMAGLNLILSDHKGLSWFALRAALVTMLAMAWFGPIKGLASRDGPRVFTGRFHAIALWHGWQQGTVQDFRVLFSVVDRAAAGQTLVVLTDNWNEDRYFHLALLERGFRPDTRPIADGPCAPVAERFARGPLRVVHLRLHQGYVPYWREIARDRLTSWALPCLAGESGARPMLVATLDRAEALLGESLVPQAEPEPAMAAGLSYGPIIAIPLDAAGLGSLRDGYGRDATVAAGRQGATPSFAAARAATRQRTGFLDGR